ncbi:MAG: OmpH family outer membrane protein [Nitrospiraceae bacterium]
MLPARQSESSVFLRASLCAVIVAWALQRRLSLEQCHRALVCPGRGRRSSAGVERHQRRQEGEDALASFTKNRQALIEMEEKELRRMEEDFMKQGSVLSPTAKRERESTRRRMAEYQQKVGDLNREVADKQKEVLTASGTSWRASGKVAKRLSLQLVLDRGWVADDLFDAGRCVGSRTRNSTAVSMRSPMKADLGSLRVGAAIALWLTSSASAADSFKVAMMDQQAVVERSVAASGRWRSGNLFDDAPEDHRFDDQELKELEAGMQDASLTEDAKKDRQAQFRPSSRPINGGFRISTARSRRSSAGHGRRVREDLQGVASAVAQKEGFTAIIDKGNEATIKIIIWASSVDLTEKVTTNSIARTNEPGDDALVVGKLEAGRCQ